MQQNSEPIYKPAATRLNAKNGAVLGAILGSAASGIALLIEPELRQYPIEEIIEGSLAVTAISSAELSAIGYINQKFLVPAYEYVSKKIDRLSNKYSTD